MGRVVVFAAVLLAACSAVAASNAPYVLQRGQIDLAIGPDGNTVILDAPQGLVVFDTGRHAEHAQAILDYARSTGKPIAAIVNSHWHLDHTTGNRDIRAAYPRAEIVASDAVEGALAGFLADSKENAKKALANPNLDPAQRQRIARSLSILTDPADLVPAHPVTKSGKRTIAGREFEVRLAPAAATAGDVWLLAADENLAVVGDLVVAQVPFFDTGCEAGWGRALDQIAKAKWDTLIPGHGEPMNRAQFDRWHKAFDAYVDCAKGNATAEDCAAGWERDAAGFYTKGEAASVHDMAVYYVTDVLRAPPAQRMDYCRA
jgi:glyoxylase-like metal-dependent hydrolase (beta-lactamase superfamily II)